VDRALGVPGEVVRWEWKRFAIRRNIALCAIRLDEVVRWE
jgi:hypothetical protein